MRILIFCFFFFSSRRRHTRLTCDWSSDVCSSDLARAAGHRAAGRGPEPLMITFVLLAAALTVAGVIAVAIPLLRRGTGATTPTTPAPWAALAATVLLVIGSAMLYVSWSNWPWKAVIPADSPQSMVARLARQLERDPQNLDGWLMLGRSYIALQEYPLALRSFERADRLSGGQNAEALTGEAEALVLTDESELNGRAGRLIERALVVAPDSGKALFFGGAVAARRGDLPLARARFA